MKINLAYGEGHLAVEFPRERTVVIEPTAIAATVAETLKKLGDQARVAVLPQGPLTIPYLKSNAN